jgi:hypothetical protein
MNILTKLANIFLSKQMPAPKASHAYASELGKATALTLGGHGNTSERNRINTRTY